MTSPKASFSVNVDVTNPGQFFACCGLLELAHRLWPGTEGWFDGGRFNIIVQGHQENYLEKIVDWLRNCRWHEDQVRGAKSIYPLQHHSDALRLDWWLRLDWYGFRNKPKDKQAGWMSSELKLWAGNQSSLQIAQKLTNALADKASLISADMLNYDVPLTGRFGVDPRAAWNALDVGFSPNTQSMTVNTYPAVEILAAIGLQRFLPLLNGQGTMSYSIWSHPLSITVATAACAALISTRLMRRFTFGIVDRGSYKGFDFAIPTGGNK